MRALFDMMESPENKEAVDGMKHPLIKLMCDISLLLDILTPEVEGEDLKEVTSWVAKMAPFRAFVPSNEALV